VSISSNTGALVPRADILSAMLGLLTCLKESAVGLPPLPECGCSVTMKLYYYDEKTPSYYEPPLFTPGNRQDLLAFNRQPVRDAIGDLATGYHVVRVVVEAVPAVEESEVEEEDGDYLANVLQENLSCATSQAGKEYEVDNVDPSTQALIEGLRRGDSFAASLPQSGGTGASEDLLDDEEESQDNLEATQRIQNPQDPESAVYQNITPNTLLFRESSDEFLSGKRVVHARDNMVASSDLLKSTRDSAEALLNFSSPLTQIPLTQRREMSQDEPSQNALTEPWDDVIRAAMGLGDSVDQETIFRGPEEQRTMHETLGTLGHEAIVNAPENLPMMMQESQVDEAQEETTEAIVNCACGENHVFHNLTPRSMVLWFHVTTARPSATSHVTATSLFQQPIPATPATMQVTKENTIYPNPEKFVFSVV
jgi:hypothetical protein